jgi:hypothetical protein
MLSPRNQIEIVTLPKPQVETVDTLYEICNAEFNSRQDIHSSFNSARGAASWARYVVLHEVRKVAKREEMYCSYHMAFVVASKLSEVWFAQKELA